jgi:thiamine biosynthesis lipoprotein
MKKIFPIYLVLICLPFIIHGQSFVSKDSVFQASVKENKPVFLVFSGSDWCSSCIRFEKNVLLDNDFQSFLSGHLLYLNADFPQRKKLPPEEVRQNEALAELYNRSGTFPALFLVSPSGKTVAVSYQRENASQFIEKMKKALISLNENF